MSKPSLWVYGHLLINFCVLCFVFCVLCFVFCVLCFEWWVVSEILHIFHEVLDIIIMKKEQMIWHHSVHGQ
jgi:hypothetical protein